VRVVLFTFVVLKKIPKVDEHTRVFVDKHVVQCVKAVDLYERATYPEAEKLLQHQVNGL
jgi:hypothetical protein